MRRALRAAGFRFRLHRRDLPGTPDIVLPKYKAVVFVHGCFWQGHGCKAFRMPATNVSYWAEKIAKNKRRDMDVVDALKDTGWSVYVIWGCDIAEGTARLLETLRMSNDGDPR